MNRIATYKRGVSGKLTASPNIDAGMSAWRSTITSIAGYLNVFRDTVKSYHGNGDYYILMPSKEGPFGLRMAYVPSFSGSPTLRFESVYNMNNFGAADASYTICNTMADHAIIAEIGMSLVLETISIAISSSRKADFAKFSLINPDDVTEIPVCVIGFYTYNDFFTSETNSSGLFMVKKDATDPLIKMLESGSPTDFSTVISGGTTYPSSKFAIATSVNIMQPTGTYYGNVESKDFLYAIFNGSERYTSKFGSRVKVNGCEFISIEGGLFARLT